MFFKPRLNQLLDATPIRFSTDTVLELPDVAAAGYLQRVFAKLVASSAAVANAQVCPRVCFSIGFPEEIRTRISREVAFSGNREEYALLIGADVCRIYVREECGLLYAMATLEQLLDHGELCSRLLYDYPLCSVRGYRVYMPGRENIGIFKEMIDLLVYYKYNAIILEIGGAMEYKRHPEINEKWVEFCDDMRRYSNRAKEVHKKYPYMKNSVHCENGDGSYLTQEECADIAAYCRERGLEVIPECPTLSHADYLLLPHPEFAEREGDEIPDTYCPRHPGVYEYVFEVLDEVIDVFQPKRMNIGHDEFYSMCLCDRCRGADPVDIFITDITRLRDHLASRGVGTMMWGEKLLKAISPTGKHYGGWYDEKDYNGIKFKVPDMYMCADKMPSGVTFLQWYWIFGKHLDRVYHDNGYPMVFGNFTAISCEDFRERIDWGCKGGFVSNWGSNEEEYMQRNLQYYNLISTAYAFWSADYDYARRAELNEITMQENYRRHYSGKKNLIRVLHTTEHAIPFKHFWCGSFITDADYLLGHYELRYTDGTNALFPVKYGSNISCCRFGEDKEFNPDDGVSSSALHEVSGAALPRILDNTIYYECAFENPHPDKEIAGISYVPCEEKKDISVRVKEIRF